MGLARRAQGVCDDRVRAPGDAQHARDCVVEPLEQVTVLMTLMKRLGQVMEHERAVLRSLRLDVLPDIQEEKVALAEGLDDVMERFVDDPNEQRRIRLRDGRWVQ